MTIKHRWFCDDCGASHKEPADECLTCHSMDVTRAPCHTSDDDGQIEAAWAAFRALSDAERDALRVKAETRLSELKALTTEAVLDQLVELARGSYSAPDYEPGFFTRKQCGEVA